MSSDIPVWAVQLALGVFVALNVAMGISAAFTARQRYDEARDQTFAMLMAMKRLEAEQERRTATR